MGFLITALIYGAVWSIQKVWAYQTQKNNHEKLKPGEYQPGTIVEEGAPIPLVYGNVLVQTPTIVWASDPTPAFIVGDSFYDGPLQTPELLQRYMLILGIPGRGVGSTADKIKMSMIFINGKRVISSTSHVLGSLSHGDTVLINHNPFFNEGLSKGMSVYGNLTFEGGHETNTNLGHDDVLATMGATAAAQWPTYSRQIKIYLTGAPRGGPPAIPQPGFFMGSSLSPPAMAFRIVNPCDVDFGIPYPKIFSMLSGDCNPIAVIYDLLVGTWGRVGLPQADIDLDNFAAVGSTLVSENHGYSAVIGTQRDAIEVIREILDQIDGVMFIEPTTNKLKIKLIRNDYDVDDLLVLDPSNIADEGVIQYNLAGRAVGYNEVRVVWTKMAGDGWESEAVVAQQDQAVINSSGGQIRSLTLHYPGVRDERVAAVIASRTVVEMSDQMATVRLRCNRAAASLRPGDAFVWSWPEYGVSAQVYRVQGIDFGTPNDRAIVIDAARDVFDIVNPIMAVDPQPPTALSLVLPLEDRVVEEVPRLFSAWTAANTGQGGDDITRGWYLARRAQATSPGYTARVTQGFRSADDMPTCGYLPTALVETAYSYSTSAYDTTTHLRITLDSAIVENFFSYTGPEVLNINVYGSNLLRIDDEILAYETITDLGGGVFRLNNIWRGLLDTVADDHAVGAVVWLLSDDIGFAAWRQVGRQSGFRTTSPSIALLPENGSSVLATTALGLESDVITTRQRNVLPYTGADFQLNGLKTLTLTEEGLVGTWKWRESLRTQVVRGDDFSDVLNPALVFLGNIYLVKTPAYAPRGAEWFMSSTSGTVSPQSSSVTSSPLGTGTMRALLRVYNQTSDLNSWTDAFVQFEAPAWRNLLRNGRFSSGAVTPGWTVVSGDIVISNDIARHGDQGFYLRSNLTGDHPDIVITQGVRLDDWPPQFMIFTLNFYEILGPDIEDPDEYLVSIKWYDASDVLLSTTTSTAAGSSTWTRHTLEDYVPATSAYAIVEADLSHVEEADPRPDVYLADVSLQVGQHTGDLAVNGHFASALAGTWTTATGSWTIADVGAAGWNGPKVVIAGSATLHELYQDVDMAGGNLPGYVAHTDFEVRWAQTNTTAIATDTGQVVVEARNVSNTVLATVSSADYNASTTFRWLPGQLILALPLGTDHVRIRLIAKRASTTGSNGTVFTDIVCYPHKKLEIAERQDLDFRSACVQRLPRDRTEWPEAFINGASTPVAMPDYGFYNGDSYQGQIGIDPELEPTTGQGKTGKFLGCYDPERNDVSTECYEFHQADDGLPATFQMFPFGEFATEQDFTMVCMIRKRTTVEAACGIAGRLDSVSGWSLQISSSGFVQAFVRGDSGTATATRANSVSDGAVHLAAIVYKGSTNTVTVVDEFGSSSASVASVGDLRASSPTFRLGKADLAQTCIPGQIARVWMWRSALSVAEVQALFTQGRLPGTTALTSYTSPGAVCSRVGSDDDGHLYPSYGAAQIPQFYDGFARGVPLPIAVTNLATTDVNETTPWVREHVSFTEGFLSPTGFYNALRQAKDNTSALRHSVTTANSNAILVVWWVRSTTGSHNARVKLSNGSGVDKETFDYSVSTQWRRKEHVFTGWDFSTATAVFRFYSSDTGTTHTVDFAGPVLITQTHTEIPICVPYKTGAAAAAAVVAPVSLTAAFNHEGEIGVRAMTRQSAPGTRDVLTVDNATNDNDKRRITTAGRFAHYNASGTEADSDATPAWTGDTPKIINARWQQGVLLDISPGTPKFAGVYYGTNSAFGRTAIFTATNTATTRITLHGSNFVIFSVSLLSREGPPGDTVPELP